MIVQWILTVITIYLLFGLIFAIPFVFKGVDVIDESAKESSFGFKLIIIPGTMVFWPLLFSKWLKASTNHSHD